MSLNNDATKKNLNYSIGSLSKGSHKEIYVNCDYCGKTYAVIMKNRTNYNKVLDKDACNDCKYTKRDELGIIKHGCANPFQRQDVKEKIKQTNNEKYGVDYFVQTKEFKEMAAETNMDRYGVEHAMLSEEISARHKAAVFDKYGVENVSQLKYVKEKREQTNLEKFGNKQFLASDIGKQKKIQGKIDKGLIRVHEGKLVSDYATELGYSLSHFHTLVKKFGFEKAITLTPQSSSLEQKIQFWLETENIQFSQHKMIGQYYYDFLLPNNILLESDGLYWHSDKVVEDKMYHYKKYEAYVKDDYFPLFFRENEIYNRFNVVTSIIKHKLGLSEKVGARECYVNEVHKNEAKLFFEANHLMGAGQGIVLGLYIEDILVAALQTKRLHDKDYEISRFCNAVNLSVVGGFSRLLKHFSEENKPTSVMTFIDRRYGNGKHLLDLGFTTEKCYVSFVWTDLKDTYHRMKFPGNTGYNYGYAKLWDCGQAKFVLRTA